jgi:hypothetical protein
MEKIEVDIGKMVAMSGNLVRYKEFGVLSL